MCACEHMKIAEIVVRGTMYEGLAYFQDPPSLMRHFVMYLCCPFSCRIGMHILVDLVEKISASTSIKLR